MTTDFCALCYELHAALEKHNLSLADEQLLDRSAVALRAAMSQPEPEGPTDEEIMPHSDCSATSLAKASNPTEST